jgi:hypothetical protein
MFSEVLWLNLGKEGLLDPLSFFSISERNENDATGIIYESAFERFAKTHPGVI